MARRAALAIAADCDDEVITVTFDDGRTLRKSFAGLRFLETARPSARRDLRIYDRGSAIYWPRLDEVLGVDRVLGVPEDEVLDLLA